MRGPFGAAKPPMGQLEAPRGRRGEFYWPPVKLSPPTTWSFQLPHLFQLVVLLRRKAQKGGVAMREPWCIAQHAYARPQNVFVDGVYQRAILELSVDMTRRHRHKTQGFPHHDYRSVAWLCHNCGNPAGEEHVRLCEPEDERVPVGCSQVRSY